MIRLSKKAWNNVIIFTMLLMILLFNTTNNILTGGDNDTQRGLLPEGAEIATLQMPDVNIERVGQGWRTKPASAYAEQALFEVVERWQDMTLMPYSGNLPSGMPIIVIIWLLGENSGRVVQLYQDGNDTIVLYNQSTFLVRDILPPQLIVEKQ